jgi:hypothetical protein
MMSSFVTVTPSSNIVRVIKSRRKRCARNEALMGEEKDVVGKYEGKGALRRLMLRCEGNVKVTAQRKVGVDRSDVNKNISGSFCERGNELLVSINCGEFVD